MPAMGRRVRSARGGAAAASLGLMSAVWSLAVCASEGLMIVAPESDAAQDPTFVPVTGLPEGFMLGQPAWDESALSAVAFGYDADLGNAGPDNPLKLVQLTYDAGLKSASAKAVVMALADMHVAAAAVPSGMVASEAALGIGIADDGGQHLVKAAASSLRTNARVVSPIKNPDECSHYAAATRAGLALNGRYATLCMNDDDFTISSVVLNELTGEAEATATLKAGDVVCGVGLSGFGTTLCGSSVLIDALDPFTPAPTDAPLDNTADNTVPSGYELVKVNVLVVVHAITFAFDGPASDFSDDAIASLEAAIAEALGLSEGSAVVLCVCDGACSVDCDAAVSRRTLLELRGSARRLLQTGSGVQVKYHVEVAEGDSAVDISSSVTGDEFLLSVATELQADPNFPQAAVATPPDSASQPIPQIIQVERLVETNPTTDGGSGTGATLSPEDDDELTVLSDSGDAPVAADALLKLSAAGHSLIGPGHTALALAVLGAAAAA